MGPSQRRVRSRSPPAIPPLPAHVVHGAPMVLPCTRLAPAATVLAAHGLEPVKLSVRTPPPPRGSGVHLAPRPMQAKEGLALINGTQLIASLGCEAVVRAKNIARCVSLTSYAVGAGPVLLPHPPTSPPTTTRVDADKLTWSRRSRSRRCAAA